MGIEFLKVDVEMVAKYGADVAVFFAYLKFVSKTIRKDEYGYFRFDANYVCRGLGWSSSKFKRIRDRSVQLGLIDHIAGQNQNEKPRYRVR